MDVLLEFLVDGVGEYVAEAEILAGQEVGMVVQQEGIGQVLESLF